MYIEVFKNVVSEEERRVLLDSHRFNENAYSYKNPPRTWTYLVAKEPRFAQARDMYHSILARTLSPHENCSAPMVTDLGGPTMLHHDYLGDGYDVNIIIPLEIFPSNAKAFTAIFEQQETQAKYTLFTKTALRPGRSPRTNDYSSLLNLRDETVPFNEELYEKYFKFLDIKDLAGLSINQVLEWELGDVIAFNCRLVHTSGDYKTYGLETKAYASTKIRFT